MTEHQIRESLVAEARSWVGTPYRIRGRIKGAGADCGSLLMSIAVNCGMMVNENLEAYSADCWAHWSDEKYLRNVMKHTSLVMQKVAYRRDRILPGCILLTRCAGARFFNHGGIVTSWPLTIHALYPKVEEIDATRHCLWSFREVAIFDFNKVRDVQ